MTSRAVARLNVLAELCLPYAKVDGVFLAMKGALADEEIDEARRGIAQLGGSIERVYEYPIQDAVHKAVVIRKQKPTPPKYPRAFAKIKKSPLLTITPAGKFLRGFVFPRLPSQGSCQP